MYKNVQMKGRYTESVNKVKNEDVQVNIQTHESIRANISYEDPTTFCKSVSQASVRASQNCDMKTDQLPGAGRYGCVHSALTS